MIESGVPLACFPQTRFRNLDAELAYVAIDYPAHTVTCTPEHGMTVARISRNRPGSNPVFCELAEMMYLGKGHRYLGVDPSAVHHEAVKAFNEHYPEFHASVDLGDQSREYPYYLRVYNIDECANAGCANVVKRVRTTDVPQAAVADEKAADTADASCTEGVQTKGMFV